MKKLENILVKTLLFALLFSGMTLYGQFVKNEGQLVDFEQNLVEDVLYYQNTGATDYYFTKNSIQYFYKKTNFKANRELSDQENYKLFMEDSIGYVRIDMVFEGSNEDVVVKPLNKLTEYNNYYLAHIPNGVTNVPLSEGVFYENIYNNIDVSFYFKDNSLKYDIILNEGANIADVKLFFEGCENLVLKNNELIFSTVFGEVKEILPRSFEIENGVEIDKEVEYNLNANKVTFKVDYNKNNKLIIDPQVVWQTLYEESFGIGRYNAMDSKGDKLVNTGYLFSANYPTLNPGGGAYFQSSVAGSGDIRIVQFDTSGVRLWSTYYGGTDYEHTSDIGIDGNGNIIVAMVTESSDIPTQNAGGYYDASFNNGSTNSSFIVRFNTNGVRNWGTHYDYVAYPMVIVDNANNYYVVGSSEYENPPVQALGGAWNQATVALDAGSGPSDDIFIIKFNSTTARVWATNLGSSSDEGPADLAIDASNNFYILGYGDNYYGTGIVTQNAGGYFDNALGTGTGGTSADRGDILIYKFSAGGALLWGTAFGGDDFEWAWPTSSSITCDASNNVYICATTRSADLPVTDPGGGAYYDGTFSNPTASGNPENHFIARFNSSTALNWCTYWGDRSSSYSTFHGVELAFSNSNQLTVAVGAINGDYYPLQTKAGSYSQAYNQGDVHIAQFNSNFGLDWATYYGSSSDQRLGELVFAENSDSFFMNGSWGTDPLWVTPPAGAYYDGINDNSAQIISKFTNVICDVADNTTSTAAICEGGTKPLIGTPSGGTWAVVSGGGTISGSNVYTPDDITSNTTVTISYTIPASGGCPLTSDNVVFTVNAEPETPSAPTGTTPVCNGSSGNYAVTAVTGATSYTWSYSGTGTPSGSSATTSMTPTTGGNLTVTATNACGTSSASSPLAITVTPVEDASFNYLANTFCISGGDPAPDPLSIVTSGGTFSINNGGTINASTGEVDLDANGVQNYTVYYTTSGTCPGIDSAVVNVTSGPQATFSYTGTPYCGGTGTASVTYGAGGSAGTFALVTPASGLVIDGVTGAVDLNASLPGTYTVENDIEASGGCAASYATSDITITAQEDATYSYGSTTFCESESDPIATITGTLGGAFTATPAGLTIDGTTGEIDLSTSTFGSVSTNYTVRYITPGTCSDTLDINVTLEPSPTAPTTGTTAGSNTICEGESADITASGSTGTGVSYSVFDAMTGGTNLGGTPLTVSPTTTTTYYVESFNSNGCGNVGGRQAVTVTVNPTPSVSAGSDETICPTDIITLTATGTGNVVWSTTETTASIDVSPAVTTTYTVTLTDANTCTNSDDVTVTVITNGGSLIAVDDAFTTETGTVTNLDVLLNDTYGGNTSVVVLTPENGTGTANIDGSIDYQSDAGFVGTDSLTYEICDITCATICDTATVIITVDKTIEFSVPGGFSPNGDNINDNFVIQGLDVYPDNNLSIFNRWGSLIYQAAPYNNDWDGKATEGVVLMGDKVTTGTYFYILELGDGVESLRGSIEIKRD